MMTPEQREAYSKKRSKQSSEQWRGVPKTKIQKARMSIAKTGVLKSDDHKANMSLTARQLVKDCRVLQMTYCIEYYEARALRKRMQVEGTEMPVYEDAERFVARINYVRKSNGLDFQAAYRSVMGCNKPTS